MSFDLRRLAMRGVRSTAKHWAYESLRDCRGWQRCKDMHTTTTHLEAGELRTFHVHRPA
jgi:hypothetical protein